MEARVVPFLSCADSPSACSTVMMNTPAARVSPMAALAMMSSTLSVSDFGAVKTAVPAAMAFLTKLEMKGKLSTLGRARARGMAETETAGWREAK